MTELKRLVVVMAFDSDPETGETVAAMEPMQFETADRAVRKARELAEKHTGVIAWSRTADPDIGEYGDPEELFRSGEIGDID